MDSLEVKLHSTLQFYLEKNSTLVTLLYSLKMRSYILIAALVSTATAAATVYTCDPYADVCYSICKGGSYNLQCETSYVSHA
jgi:hypothetical protein